MGKTTKLFRSKERGIKITRLMARDGCNCSLCGQPLNRRIKDPDHPYLITFDHIVPKCEGGDDDIRNLQLAHRVCNQMRGTTPIDEWVA